jgi:flagellar hook-length control protein FliK
MTSAPINDYSVMSVYPGTKVADNGISNEKEGLGNFQNAMDRAKNMQTDTVKTDTTKTDTGRVQTSGSAQTNSSSGVTRTVDAVAAQSNSSKVKDTVESTAQKNTDKAAAKDAVKDTAKETVADSAESTEKEVVGKIAEKLDVTEEEVTEAMETLGLTILDLTDQGNMAALVTELTGEEDPMALVTDGELFADIQQLSADVAVIIEQNVEDLSAELGLDSEEVLPMLEDVVRETAAAVDDAEPVKTGVVVEIERDVEEPVNQAADTAEVKETADADEENPVMQTTKETDNSDHAEEQGHSMMNANQENSPLVNQMFNPETVATDNVTEIEIPVASYVDTEDIINQIGEYVKIHQSETVSEMEISLNPESLGNIHLQVAAKEGVITATITAQNETVRDALMVQAMTLKEELNDQGLKVEAVDVTVASHEFERDMHQGGEEARNLFEQQVRKQSRRRIMIDGLAQAEELLEDENLTDAERLQIDMMAKSGSSVDFTA